jgi:hypothetical protein
METKSRVSAGRALWTSAFPFALAALFIGAIIWSEQRTRAQVNADTNSYSEPTASSCTIPNFSPTTSPLSFPRVMTSGDFNKDGKLDLAAGQVATSGALTIMLGDGAGGFSQTSTPAVMRGPSTIVAVDLNGDGNLDLITGNADPVEGSIFVFMGNGNGTFGLRKSFLFGISPFRLYVTALAIGDVNGDGKLDAVIATDGSLSGGVAPTGITTVLGDGAGNFTQSTSKSSGGLQPSSILLQDVNGDSKLDVIVANAREANSSNGNIAILTGDGTGTFNNAVTTPVQVGARALISGDFNGDSKLDLAFNSGSGSVSVMTGNGAGSFAAPVNIDVPGVTNLTLVSGDFNGDGKIDFAVSNGRPGSVVILNGNGAGSFTPVANFSHGGPVLNGLTVTNVPLVVGDFTGDGNQDLAVSNSQKGLLSMLLNSCGTPLVNQIQFTAASTGVSEGEDTTNSTFIGVIRTGDIIGTAGAMVSSSDGTATAPADYAAVSQPLSFAQAEIFKPVSTTIVDDTIPEFPESFNLTLSGVTGNAALGTPSSTVVQIFDNDTSQINLDTNASNAVVEGTPGIAVKVMRSGNTNGSATVDYTTSDTAGSAVCDQFNGKASSRCDYVTTAGTLNFAPGDTEKTVTIPIIDDSFAEGLESFSFKLSNATGPSVFLGANSINIAINDNESTTGANPIDVASSFVRLQYLDFLNREPDASGGSFWTNQITSCGSDTTCTEVRRINTSGAFFLSIEFQQTGYLVERIYKTAYGDASGASTLGGSHQLAVPVVRLSEFLADTQQIGRGVVVLQPGWEQALEANKQEFVNRFVQRTRFTEAFPVEMTATAFVDGLNNNAGRPLSQFERDSLVSDLLSNAKTRGQVLRTIAEHQKLVSSESNRAFVLMQFFGYLRRNPNDTPDSDYTGYDFWLSKLSQFNGDYIAAEMVKAFISSSEYRKRFGP